MEGGASGPKLAREMGCNIKTIYATRDRAKDMKSTKSRARNGAPRKMDERTKRMIVREVRKNEGITYEKLRKSIGVDISDTTFYRVLKEEGVERGNRKKKEGELRRSGGAGMNKEEGVERECGTGKKE